MRHPRFGSLLSAFWLAALPAAAADLPPCAGPAQARGGEVLRVEANGALVLKDGRVVALEGLRLRDGIAVLSAMVMGKHVMLAVPAPKEDRHGRLRAQVSIGGAWLQEALLREGLARVALLPSHPQCAKEMYAAEAAARSAKRGLWALSEYAVRSVDGLAHDRGTFQIVEGRVVSASVKGGRAYVNFSADWDRDFTVTIAPDAMKIFRARNVNPRDYAGKQVRVRGVIDWYHGPEIELMGPESVEVVQ
ncbi:MAG TPA: thermonuclease family protein [Rhizomicrobium sp.]|jgi:hypothetical protein